MSTVKWNIDPTHSEISFKIKHMMISSVRGHFDEFQASVEAYDDTFKDANFNFNAKIKSINTNNKERDNHLKSEDFFESDKFPELSFKSKSFDGKTLFGDLTIKDITKEIALDVEFNGIVVDPYGYTKSGFEMEGIINRKEFNLNWGAVTEAGKIMVGDRVKLSANLQFIKQ